MHPLPESYQGCVNTLGMRSCYVEGNECKRIAETLCFDYKGMDGSKMRVMRIFSSYCLRIFADDGRVVRNFIMKTLHGQHLNLYGDGSQSLSWFYLDDLIEGIIRLMNGQHTGPFYIGNHGEFTIRQLPELVRSKINPDLPLIKKPLPAVDPLQRQPVIKLAQQELGWQPSIACLVSLLEERT